MIKRDVNFMNTIHKVSLHITNYRQKHKEEESLSFPLLSISKNEASYK